MRQRPPLRPCQSRCHRCLLGSVLVRGGSTGTDGRRVDRLRCLGAAAAASAAFFSAAMRSAVAFPKAPICRSGRRLGRRGLGPSLGGGGFLARDPRRLVASAASLAAAADAASAAAVAAAAAFSAATLSAAAFFAARLGGGIGVRLAARGIERGGGSGLRRIGLGLRLRESPIGSSAIRRRLLSRRDRCRSRCRLLGSELGCLIGGRPCRGGGIGGGLRLGFAAAFAATARSVASRDAASSAAARVSISISRLTWNAASFSSAAAAAAWRASSARAAASRASRSSRSRRAASSRSFRLRRLKRSFSRRLASSSARISWMRSSWRMLRYEPNWSTSMVRTGSPAVRGRRGRPGGTAPSTSVSPGSKVSVQSLSRVIALRSMAALPTAFAFAASIGEALQPDRAGGDGERRLGLVEGQVPASM